jgi:hypothetical protein
LIDVVVQTFFSHLARFCFVITFLHFFFFFFLDLPALAKAIAIACFLGLPALISFLMLADIVF